MKKFKDPHNIHLRRFFLLSIVIFILSGIGNLILVINNFPIVVDEITMSIVANYLSVFVSFMMALMGIYYYRANKK
jgi:hypothetical protein